MSDNNTPNFTPPYSGDENDIEIDIDIEEPVDNNVNSSYEQPVNNNVDPNYGQPANNANYADPNYGQPANNANYADPNYGQPANNANYADPNYGQPANNANYADPNYGQPANNANYADPNYGQPANNSYYADPNYGQPANNNNYYDPNYAQPQGNDMNNGGIPTFTPPGNDMNNGGIPTFTPPGGGYGQGTYGVYTCYHHPSEPAAGQCARCGKNICQDCVDNYTVISGEYANQCLCYDCCEQIVSENVVALKKQRRNIITLFAATLVGMLIGLAIGSGGGPVVAIFCMLWFGSFWNWIKNSVLAWWNNPQGRSYEGFVGPAIIYLFIAPFKTMMKLIDCIRFWIRTQHAIENDTASLAQMAEYMEYTQYMENNKGVDIQTLMGQNSQLYNNSYAQTVAQYGEQAAEEQLRRCTTTIAENGEIIRNFAA